MEIQVVNGLAGSCKSKFLKRHVAAMAYKHNQKSVIMVPSRLLGEQTEKDLRSFARGHGVKITRIDGQHHPYRVIRDVMQHLKDTDPHCGEVLIIQQAAGLTLPYWHNKDKWHAYIDEVHDVFHAYTRNIPDSHQSFTKHVDAKPSPHDNYLELTVKPGGEAAITNYAKNSKNDEGYDLYQGMSSKLIDPHCKVYTLASSWQRVVAGQGDRDSQIHVFGVTQPSAVDGFANVTYLSALFDLSTVAIAWTELWVTFVEHQRLSKKLKYKKHPNGHLVDIYYVLDDDWTKTARGGPEGDKLLSAIFEEVSKVMRGMKDYLIVLNEGVDMKKRSAADKRALKNGTPIVTKSHGLNDYETVDALFFGSSLNASPPFGKFLDCCMTIDKLRYKRANYLSTVYQSVMRTSIRKPENTDRKRIFVVDKLAADFLHDLLPGSTVTKVGDLARAGKRHANEIWASKASQKQAWHFKQGVLKDLGEQDTTPRFTIVPYKESTQLLAEDVTSIDAFIAELHDAHNAILGGKHQNVLISPAHFDIYKCPETKRGVANVVSLMGIWLDNDGGDLPFTTFASLFDNLHMVGMNTFTKGNYRVFIPYTKPCTVLADKIIKRQIMDKVRAAGYGDKNSDSPLKHGFDTGKLVASSLFYLPAQAGEPQYSFFTELPGEDVDPCKWIEGIGVEAFVNELPESTRHLHTMQQMRNKLGIGVRTTFLQQAIDDAVEVYKLTPKGKQQRYRAFFLLGLSLKNAGLDYASIEVELTNADYDGSRNTKKQIKGVIKSLKQGPSKQVKVRRIDARTAPAHTGAELLGL